jgi:hypothetical protein
MIVHGDLRKREQVSEEDIAGYAAKKKQQKLIDYTAYQQ